MSDLRIFGRISAAATESRTLSGEVVAYGRIGMTSIGPLRVKAGALRWPDDVTRVKMTEEHDRARVRGYVTSLADGPERLRATVKATDDEDGTLAIAEAQDRKRDGFSLDVVNGSIEDATDGGPPWLVSGDLIAIGQVGLPAFYEGSRIDQVAASVTSTKRGESMTEEQRRRLAELAAKNNRSAEEETEFGTLSSLAVEEATAAPADAAPADAAPADAAPAPQAVAASVPTVPAGIPRPRAGATTTRKGALDNFITTIVDALKPGGGGAAAITAALSDVTHTQHSGNIAEPAWSGELWSGLNYESEFVPLLNSGDLTSYEGKGWRWVTKPEMQDYTGNKAAVPSDVPDTEAATYTAARMAVGHDIDRKFYDFPDAEFLRAYVEAVRESWAIKLDGKVEAYIGANAVDSGIDMIDETDTAAVLKGVGKLARSVKRARLGKASFVVMSDTLFDTLLDVTNLDVPAFLDLFGVDPSNFTSSDLAAFDGKIVAGTKMAATVRTLPGSPIRVEAQRIANGGIDNGFFGYWAIETHATNGIQYVEVGDVTP